MSFLSRFAARSSNGKIADNQTGCRLRRIDDAGNAGTGVRPGTDKIEPADILIAIVHAKISALSQAGLQ
jgi:hypothetical protein